jgi:hypothetical protein
VEAPAPYHLSPGCGVHEVSRRQWLAGILIDAVRCRTPKLRSRRRLSNQCFVETVVRKHDRPVFRCVAAICRYRCRRFKVHSIPPRLTSVRSTAGRILLFGGSLCSSTPILARKTALFSISWRRLDQSWQCTPPQHCSILSRAVPVYPYV